MDVSVLFLTKIQFKVHCYNFLNINGSTIDSYALLAYIVLDLVFCCFVLMFFLWFGNKCANRQRFILSVPTYLRNPSRYTETQY